MIKALPWTVLVILYREMSDRLSWFLNILFPTKVNEYTTTGSLVYEWLSENILSLINIASLWNNQHLLM